MRDMRSGSIIVLFISKLLTFTNLEAKIDKSDFSSDYHFVEHHQINQYKHK